MSRANAVNAADPGNVWGDVLVWGTRWDSGAAALTTIEVHVAGARAANFDGERLTSFAARAQELASVNRTLQLYENIANVDFVQTANLNAADVWIAHVNDADAGGGLGVAVFPGDVANAATGDDQGQMIVNRDAYATANLASLRPGGFDFATYIHEFGHVMGLDHPHDAPNRFPGVTAEFDDYGDFNMNQGIFTVMSYNDGFPAGRLGLTPSTVFGYAATPMALDVAALQHLYGANRSFRTGNDVYTLASANAAGTGYSCIWDAGGIDTIVNRSAKASMIDLNAATLLRAPGGGGVVSSVGGVHGGFTIANGVTIENATGGSAADTITGNAAANRLSGAAGTDTLRGQGGNDVLVGGPGQDRLFGGTGNDRYVFQSLLDSGSAGGQRDIVGDFTGGADRLHFAALDANAALAGNQAFEFLGESPHAPRGTADLWFSRLFAAGVTLVFASTDADAAPELSIQLNGLVFLQDVDFIL